jgi:hypothetical protein
MPCRLLCTRKRFERPRRSIGTDSPRSKCMRFGGASGGERDLGTKLMNSRLGTRRTTIRRFSFQVVEHDASGR